VAERPLVRLTRCGLMAPEHEPVRLSYLERLRRYMEYQVREAYESGIGLETVAAMFELSVPEVKRIILKRPRCVRCGRPLNSNEPFCEACAEVLRYDRGDTGGRYGKEDGGR